MVASAAPTSIWPAWRALLMALTTATAMLVLGSPVHLLPIGPEGLVRGRKPFIYDVHRELGRECMYRVVVVDMKWVGLTHRFGELILLVGCYCGYLWHKAGRWKIPNLSQPNPGPHPPQPP